MENPFFMHVIKTFHQLPHVTFNKLGIKIVLSSYKDARECKIDRSEGREGAWEAKWNVYLLQNR